MLYLQLEGSSRKGRITPPATNLDGVSEMESKNRIVIEDIGTPILMNRIHSEPGHKLNWS